MGAFVSFARESFPPQPTWTPQDMPDLAGKVMLVTGANTGIGKETAKHLLAHGAKVYIACRSAQKAEAAIRDLQAATGREALFLQLDLADLRAVKAAAQEFLSKEGRLDVLFNNAGVMLPPSDLLTTDGYDLQFGTNVLGHFYFTRLLLPLLTASARSSPDGCARVVTTSSVAHLLTNTLVWDAFRDGPARRRLGARRLYVQSKFANILFACELTRRCGDTGVVSMAVNPGNIKTDLWRHTGRVAMRFNRRLLHPIQYGPLTQLYAGTAPETAALNGKYFVPWAQVGRPRRGAQDPAAAQKLWEWMEGEVTKIDMEVDSGKSELGLELEKRKERCGEDEDFELDAVSLLGIRRDDHMTAGVDNVL